IQEKFILFSPKKKFKKIKITRALNWDSYADPKRNIVNINKNRRHFKGLIENKSHLIRIALHPRDPVHALKDQIEMIIQLKEQGYEIAKYADLAPKLQNMSPIFEM
ncbi:MAG: hypothetical protein M3044_14410, partial [Thermoproteota archaeon]|nr:hypothetical protein [Thermoproteota archaeon]